MKEALRGVRSIETFQREMLGWAVRKEADGTIHFVHSPPQEEVEARRQYWQNLVQTSGAEMVWKRPNSCAPWPRDKNNTIAKLTYQAL